MKPSIAGTRVVRALVVRFAPVLGAALSVSAISACPPPVVPPPDATITAACTDPTTVPCRDQSLVALSMYTDATVTPGVISDAVSGDKFHPHVDASVGGFNASKGYVYAKFTDDGLQKVDISDDESFDSMDWDIAFHRFIIRLNSGTGGPSCVTAARTAPNTAFADAAVADNLTFNQEQFMSPDTCDIIADGSGLPNAPGTVLQGYWQYSSQQCLQMTNNVYVLELANGHHVKLQVTNFYDDAAQSQCNSDGTLAPNHQSAQMQFDWAKLD